MATEVMQRTGDEGGRGGKSATAGSSRWWATPAPKNEETPPSVHGKVTGYVARLRSVWTRAEIIEACWDRLYEGRSLRQMRGAVSALEGAGYSLGRLMVTTSIVDTFTSRFARRRTTPTMAVDEGEWDLKQKAIEFSKFLRGKLVETGVERLRPEVINDCSVRGNGVLYIDEGDDDVVVERAHRRELFVDPHEAKGGDSAVRQMHRVRPVAREVLCAEYPELHDRIMAAPNAKVRPGDAGSDDWSSPSGFYDADSMVDLYESWHLPSCDDYEDDDPEMDGRKARCLENVTLCFEAWNEPRFPFAILRRHLRKQAFWGQGDVERLAPLQHDINQIARDIQQNIEAGGKLYLFTSGAGDQIPVEKFVGVRPMRVKGARPGEVQFIAPQAIAPAHQQILDSRIEYAHRFSGVADWAATARSPLGAGASGVAIDTMEDLQSDRHAAFEQREAHFWCDVAQRLLDAGRRIAQRMRDGKDKDGKQKKYEATWMEAGSLQRIAWDDAELEEGSYRLEIEPTSFLPSTRAGKLAGLAELVKNGIVPQWAAAGAFEEPDIAHTNRVVLAKYHNAERMMQMVGNPKKHPIAPVPLPYHDLDLLLAFAVAYYNRAECDIAERDKMRDKVLGRYGDFIDLTIEAIKRKKSGDGTNVGSAEIPPPSALMPPPGGDAAMPPAGPPLPGPQMPPPMMPPGVPA